MKPALFLLTVLALAAPATLALADGATPPATAPAVEPLWLEMTALDPAKAPAVEAALRGVAGVTAVEWTVAAKEARVERRVGEAADADLVKAAAGAGAAAARVPTAKADLVFEKKLHCAGCAAKAERALRKVEGTKQADVNDDRTGVAVVYDTRTGKIDAMRKALADAGYPVKP